MPRIDYHGLLGGFLVLGAGTAFAVAAAQYPLGTSDQPGPGVFPLSVALFAVAMGALICVLSLLRHLGGNVRISFRAPAAVLGSIATFALLIPKVGLLPTVFAVALVAALGSRDTKPAHALALALFMALSSWLVFIEILGMTMPAFRSPL